MFRGTSGGGGPTQSGSNPAALPVSVSNTGSGSLTFTAGSDSAWLTVTPTSGCAPQTPQAGVNISGLAPNTYTWHVTVTASGVQGLPATVTLVVSAPPPPKLSVSPTSVGFTGTQGGSNPPSVPLSVSNTGGGTVTSIAGSDSAWLSVAPTGGTAPQTLQVSVNLTEVTVTTYKGNITVTASGAQGSPATVPVTLAVNPAGTSLLGDQTTEPQVDSNTKGRAEAFQITGNVSGRVTSLTLYVDSSSTAPKMYIGIYTDSSGHPGTLLTQGTTTPAKGAWNTVSVPAANISAGTAYLDCGARDDEWETVFPGSC